MSLNSFSGLRLTVVVNKASGGFAATRQVDSAGMIKAIRRLAPMSGMIIQPKRSIQMHS